MKIQITPIQAQKCRKCEWGAKTTEAITICPWAGKCLKGDSEEIPKLPKNREE